MVLLQLVALPTALWTELPGRSALAAASALLDEERPALPLSLSLTPCRSTMSTCSGPITRRPDGTCIRDLIHVSDLAQAHVRALERLIDQPHENLVLNCGYGKGLSVLEVLDTLERELNEPICRAFKPRRPRDPPPLVASNRRRVKTLNWSTRFGTSEPSFVTPSSGSESCMPSRPAELR